MFNDNINQRCSYSFSIANNKTHAQPYSDRDSIVAKRTSYTFSHSTHVLYLREYMYVCLHFLFLFSLMCICLLVCGRFQFGLNGIIRGWNIFLLDLRQELRGVSWNNNWWRQWKMDLGQSFIQHDDHIDRSWNCPLWIGLCAFNFVASISAELHQAHTYGRRSFARYAEIP